MEQSTSPDLLADLENEIALEHASKGLRLANFLIDGIISSILYSVFGSFIQMIVMAAYIRDLDNFSVDPGFPWAIFFIIITLQLSVYIAYFTVCEKLLKGRTIGKMVTGTMALREDGNPLTWKNAILRSLCRLIPFEPLVAIFISYPWHDDFTKTVVVKKRI
ncbi:MAG: RDD family protein [Chitinophagaceae bacterium]|nr:RDD family protein [Chitinophagaceae bacterium]